MPKRPPSTAISCNGCASNFDPEVHIPLVGSCGDSMCAVCVDEKKIETCPVCSEERAFASKKKNKLALEFMSMMADFYAKDSKRAKLDEGEETFSSEEPISAILDPKNRPFLAHVMNQLDPSSFLKFSRTCKEIHKYCFNTKEINIIHDDFRLHVAIRHRVPVFKLFKKGQPSNDYFSQNYKGKRGKFVDYRKNRQTLRKYPFVFKLQSLIIQKSLNSQLLDSTRSFLAEFPVKKIDIIAPRMFSDWNGFTQFVKDFHVRKVEVYSCYGNEAMPEETMSWFLLNSETELSTDLPVSDELILKSSLNFMQLSGASISKETFETLLLKCVNSTEEIEWTLGCGRFEFGYRNFFKDALPFDHEGLVSEERPLVFFKENEPNTFYILRKDGKVVDCHKSIISTAWFSLLNPPALSSSIYFSLLNPSQYPPCLKTNSPSVA